MSVYMCFKVFVCAHLDTGFTFNILTISMCFMEKVFCYYMLYLDMTYIDMKKHIVTIAGTVYCISLATTIL